jgi:hypothetical protein
LWDVRQCGQFIGIGFVSADFTVPDTIPTQIPW